MYANQMEELIFWAWDQRTKGFLFSVYVGLGKQEQGINTCLQVEKTSKRGGKIIDKDKGIQCFTRFSILWFKYTRANGAKNKFKCICMLGDQFKFCEVLIDHHRFTFFSRHNASALITPSSADLYSLDIVKNKCKPARDWMSRNAKGWDG